MFMSPNSIAPGGVTGISMIVNHLLPRLPVGGLIIVINLPLFVMGWRSEGRTFLLKSVAGTALSSVFIDLFSGRFSYTEDALMAAIYGGLLMGAGLGLVLSRGATTGGSDIAGRLLLNRFPYMSFGRVIFAVDLCVITLAAAVFRHISYALYSIISLYVSSIVIDGILYGSDPAKIAYIMTPRTREVVEAIGKQLSRGATLLNGEGAYTGRPQQVVLCAIKRRQIAALKELVINVDPDAFMIITEAHEVLGRGFRSYGNIK